MGAGAGHKRVGSKDLKEAGGLAEGRGPTSVRRSCAQAGSGQLLNTDIRASEKLTE